MSRKAPQHPITAWLEKNKISRLELVRRSGVSRTTLYRIERRIFIPHMSTLLALHRTTGIPVRKLVEESVRYVA